ncbi:MAG: hypothetical protein IKJ68_12950 [Clostridia bacterium]|nr:hypothetical protein [Clostridia bacterium]
MKYDVIIFGGQSNMQGQTEALSECAQKEGCFEYRYLTDSLVSLKNPVGEYIKTDGTAGCPFVGDPVAEEDKFVEWKNGLCVGAATDGNTNLVPSFCQSYREACSRDVVAVHASKGATYISDWLKGTPGYEMIVKKTKAAVLKAKNVENIYFVWLQGESDACNSLTKGDYEKSITELKNSLKEDLGIKKFGIIRVGHFAGDKRDDEIINAQEAVCQMDDDFVMLTRLTSELELTKKYMNPYAKGHFSARGLELIGEVAGTFLGEIE